ncbi:hypothetical protein PTNB73_03692 [Pyrenophora teres f. teres]|nr:hypothetical protein HRS9139_02675 [Pyrenophora teres f. teres]KAE8872233.1 hypothetical protein PTNB73_03692 [Pyrenophora teres f. teres]
MASENEFQLFTSLRYDPLLLTSDENSRPVLNFVSPSPFYMLAYHRDRMVEAAQHFDFLEVEKKLQDGQALHAQLLKWTQDHIQKLGKDEAMKLRLLYDKAANLTVEFTAVPAVPLSTLYPPSLDPPASTPEKHPANTFKPSPLTGGALSLGTDDSLPAATSTPPPPPEWKIKLDTAPTPSSPFTLLKTTKREMYDQSRERALPENSAGPAYREVMLYNEVNELTEGTLTSLYLFRGGRWVTPPVGVPSGEFTSKTLKDDGADEGELRKPFAGRWGHSTRSAKVGAGGQRGTSQPTTNFSDQIQGLLRRMNIAELQHRRWYTKKLAERTRNTTVMPDTQGEDFNNGYVQIPDYTSDSSDSSSDSEQETESVSLPVNNESDSEDSIESCHLLSDDSDSDSDDGVMSIESSQQDVRTAHTSNRSRMDGLTLEYERSVDESLVRLIEEGEREREVQREIRRLMEEQEVQREKEWEQEQDDGYSGFPYRLLG